MTVPTLCVTVMRISALLVVVPSLNLSAHVPAATDEI